MEKWSFDAVEGPIRRYTVNEEIIIIQDEFVNPNNCGNCKILEDGQFCQPGNYTVEFQSKLMSSNILETLIIL